MSVGDPAPSRAPRHHVPPVALAVFRTAALFTALAVAMGAVVCATESGAACPTWPGCRPETLAPGWHLSPAIEFTHRVVAILAGPLMLAAAVLSLRVRPAVRWVGVLPWIALAGAIASGAFGRLVVVSTLPAWLGAVDLFCALTAMTATGMAAVLLAARGWRPGRVSALAGAATGVVIAVHVSGILAAGTGSYTRCIGWPLWRIVEQDPRPWLQALRLGLAGVGGVLVVAAALAAGSAGLRRWGIAVGALFALEMALGLLIEARGISDGVAVVYSLLAVTLLSCLGLLTAVSGAVPAGPSDADPLPPREELAGVR